jgi:menaquinone-9 beta-reductase
MSGAVIIGGGPAGAAAAIALARAGHAATLIERSAEARDKVCGDFLSAEALEMIARLGVDLSAASTITALRLVHRNRTAVTQLPFVARGLSRRMLDEALLRQVQAGGTTVLRGHRVTAARAVGRSIRLSCDSLGSMVADTVFLATGKHELRGVERADRGIGLVGLKMYYELAAAQVEALRHHIELILFRGGYAGLQLVEGDRAVLCALLPGARLRAVNGRRDALIDSLTDDSPHLRERLDGARALLDRALAVAGLPYGYLHAAAPQDPPGLFRLGDQAVVVPSLAGDGVSLALASGIQGAKSWLAGCNGSHFHQVLGRAVWRRVRIATALHRLCLTPALQPAVVSLAGFWPRLMRLAAEQTRARSLTHSRSAA